MDKIDFTPLEKAIKSLDEIIERYNRESYDDAIDAGVEFITEMGACSALSEDEINDEVSTFIEYKVCEAVGFYCCEVNEAHQ